MNNKQIRPKKLGRKDLRKVLSMVKKTLPDEIDCGQCYSRMEIFAEEKLEGRPPQEATRLVREHIDRCMDCHEEFQLLIKSIKQI